MQIVCRSRSVNLQIIKEIDAFWSLKPQAKQCRSNIYRLGFCCVSYSVFMVFFLLYKFENNCLRQEFVETGKQIVSKSIKNTFLEMRSYDGKDPQMTLFIHISMLRVVNFHPCALAL